MTKLFASLWIATVIALNLFALSGLLYYFGLANYGWGDPISGIGQAYLRITNTVFTLFKSAVPPQFSAGLPDWYLHALLVFVATASALAACNAFLTRETRPVDRAKNMGLSFFWPVLMPVLAWNSVRRKKKPQSSNAFSRIALLCVAAIFVTYFTARFINAKYLAPVSQQALLALNTGPAPTDEVALQCRTTMRQHISKRRRLQDNFDQAIASSDWPRAQELATITTQLAGCLDELGQVDIARIHLNIANDFYEAGQWESARAYYKTGFEAYSDVRDDITAQLQPAFPDQDIGDKVDFEMSVLFNDQALFTSRLYQLSSLGHVLETDPSGMELADVEVAIDELRNMRSRYYGVVEDTDDKQILTELNASGLAVIDGLVEALINIAKTEPPLADHKKLVQNFEAIMGQIGRFSNDEKANEKKNDIEKQLAAAYFAQGQAQNQTLTTLHYRMLHRNLMERVERMPYPEDALTADMRAELEQDKLQADSFIEIYESFSPEYRTLILADNNALSENNPYIIKAKFAERLGQIDQAEAVLEGVILRHLDRHFRSNETLDSVYEQETASLAIAYMGTGTEYDPYTIFEWFVYPDFTDDEEINMRWAIFIDTLCQKLDDQNLFQDTGCNEEVSNYLKQIIQDNIDTIIRRFPASAGEPFSGSSGLEPEYITINLLFGTTREYDDKSWTAEETFTRKDDPEGRGWRGSVTLEASKELLGPPILADAFAEGEERSKFFKFVGLPTIFGHDANAHEKFKTVLKERLANAERDEVLIYVHGVGNTFASASKRAAQLTYDLSFPGEAMFYTWPTENNFLGYFKDIDVPDFAVDDLASFIRDAAETSQKVNIIAHSHGAQVTVNALVKMKKEVEAEGKPVVLGQIILAAPDVDGNRLKEVVRTDLSKISERVTIYTNDSDKALWLSSVLRFFKLRGGLGKSDQRCSADVIDSSRSVPFGSHGYFAQESEVVADIRTLIWHHKMSPTQRCFLEAKESRRGSPWRFSKDKCDITAYDIASQIAIRSKDDLDRNGFDAAYRQMVIEKSPDLLTLEEAMRSGAVAVPTDMDGYVRIDPTGRWEFAAFDEGAEIFERDEAYDHAWATYDLIKTSYAAKPLARCQE